MSKVQILCSKSPVFTSTTWFFGITASFHVCLYVMDTLTVLRKKSYCFCSMNTNKIMERFIKLKLDFSKASSHWLQLCFESLWTCVFIYFLQVQWRLNWFSLGDWVSRFRIFNFFILKNCVVSHCLSVNSAPVGSGASELSSPLSCGPGSKVFSVIIIGGFIDVMHFVVKLSWLNLLFIMNLVFDIILRRFMTLLNTEFTWW